MEKAIDKDNDDKTLNRIKQLYEQLIDYIYLSLTNIQTLLSDTVDNTNINNIYDNHKIDSCQMISNKIMNEIKQKYFKDLKNNNNNKILYKSKLINFYLKEQFKDGNENEEYFFPFYLLSYIMIVINHHYICLLDYFNGKIKINQFKSEDIDKNLFSVILRCFIFIEMFSLYYQLKCSKSPNDITKKNKESDIILNYFCEFNTNNYMNKKILLSLNKEEKENVINLGNLSYKIVYLFLFDNESENKNIGNENILNQLINFSLLSYKDGLKTLIRSSKLKKETKIKTIQYINYEYNNNTLNLLYQEIKEQNTKHNLNINEDKDNNIIETNKEINNIKGKSNDESISSNDKKNNGENNIINENENLKEIIVNQNKEILSLKSEINMIKNEFSDYKLNMDKRINLLEMKINELEMKLENNKNNNNI